MGRQPDEAGDTDPDRSRRYVVWAVLLALVLVPFVIIEGPGSSVLRSLGLIDRDDSFTELFFPDRAALPTALAPGAPLTFDFTVRNREGGSTEYRWSVRLGPVAPSASDAAAATASSVLVQGRLRLADGEARTVHVEQIASGAPGATAVNVALSGRAEAIHFPLTITAPEPVAAPG